MATTNNKDTIYVDVDDEITTIIDKVRNSSERIVALVLPKRATVLQSIVNMKLLKRSADTEKKHLVLITTEANLMPLAATVGLHVAATPQSKPEIPVMAGNSDADEPVDVPLEDEGPGYTADNAGDRTVGELAGGSAKDADGDGDIETVALGDDDEVPTEESDSETEPGKTKKDHRLKVPNFNKFRMRLFLGVFLLVALIVGLYFASSVLPKAAITVTTNTNAINVNLTATLDSSAQALDATKMDVPAKAEQQQKTTTQQVTTTGQQNNGQPATGNVNMTAVKCSGPGTPNTVPAGTGITTNGLTFITQSDTNFQYSGISGGCADFTGTKPTPITAQAGGAKYNVSGASFTVAGRSDASAAGSASGGTDNVVQVVTQADIDNAKQKLSSQDTSAVQTALEQALRLDGLYPLPATFNAGTPVITTSNNVGDQASTVTVTQAVTYTMYGAKQSDLDTLIKGNVNTQIDTSNQSILDDGLANAKVTVNSTGNGTVQIALQTTATVGPDISVTQVKQQAAGKKSGDVQSALNQITGVTSVNVHLSPFWVSTVPTNLNKITVTITGANSGAHPSGS